MNSYMPNAGNSVICGLPKFAAAGSALRMCCVSCLDYFIQHMHQSEYSCQLFLLQGFRDEQGRNFVVYILKGLRKTMPSAL
jgi:hypothetical protein